MSHLIHFLERLGADAGARHQSEADYATAVTALPVDDQARDALLARDADALGGLLGGRLQMMCILFPADGDEKKDDDQKDGDEVPAEKEDKPSVGF